MMRTRYYYLTGILLFAHLSFSQSIGQIDINDIRATFFSDGRFGWDPVTSSPAFEVPLGSGLHALYAGAPWIGAKDPSGNLHLAAMRYGQIGNDYWSGPLGTGASTTASIAAQWDRVFSITRVEVDQHIAYFNCMQDPLCDAAVQFPGYQTPANLVDWPAHGDVAFGQDYDLAPYVDHDLDGNYDPQNGDYPCFPGDQALYFIFNDAKQHTESGGDPLGVELRVMVYAYDSGDPALNQTIFMNYTIKNQSSITYSDTYFGLFADFDLGDYQDDYIGSDVERSMMYVYNSTNNDAQYGVDPPALGIAMLQGPHVDADGSDNPLGSSLPAINGVGFGDGIVDNERYGLSTFSYSGSFFSDPSFASAYYNSLQGLWADGSPLFYGGNGHMSGGADTTLPTSFVYPDDSDPAGSATGGIIQAPWNEYGLSNIADDRRGLGSSGPFTLAPGGMAGIDLAFVYGRALGYGYLASIDSVQQRADRVRQFFFDSGLFSGPVGGPCSAIVPFSVQEAPARFELYIFPNPGPGLFEVSIPGHNDGASIMVYDMYGKLVLRQFINGSGGTISLEDEVDGLYLFKVESANRVRNFKIMKKS